MGKKENWWEPITSTLLDNDLHGLKSKCPVCGEQGVVVSRWVKGSSTKPIYIIHIRRCEVRNICKLDDEQSQKIRGHVPILYDDVKKLLRFNKSYVLFSGGKDSLATLYYLRKLTKDANEGLTAIYVDTTAGLPESKRYVKKVCRHLKIKLTIVRPEVDYFTLAKQWGIPSFRYRWCCRELKIKPIEKYLAKIKEPKVVFDGIRAAESYIRKQYIPIWYHPSFKCLAVSPIFYWSNQKVDSFINSDGIPKTLLHEMGTSTECWCGAYKTENDFRKLYELNKDMFLKLSEIEKANRNRFTFLYKNGQQIPLRKLEKQILREKGE